MNSLISAALLATWAAPALAASVDPYDALKAMEGHWVATTSHGRIQTVENRCARTGLFFVCEQVVGGKPAALVVFLPKETGGRRLVFHTQTLTAAGDRPGPWRELTVEADRWTYSSLDKAHGKEGRVRTVDTFSGPDFMHVETQASTDGESWTTLRSEDLNRAP
ncbi:MAG TPA: hypothetical protein VIB82_08990 [Caulobacteraceae bacterium]|jgi:hypothetical protein